MLGVWGQGCILVRVCPTHKLTHGCSDAHLTAGVFDQCAVQQGWQACWGSNAMKPEDFLHISLMCAVANFPPFPHPRACAAVVARQWWCWVTSTAPTRRLMSTHQRNSPRQLALHRSVFVCVWGGGVNTHSLMNLMAGYDTGSMHVM
jgi:hypothetical protein